MLARPPTPIADLPASVPHPPALPDGTWCAARLDIASEHDLGTAMFEVVMWFPHGLPLGPGRAGTITITREAAQALLPQRLSGSGSQIELQGDVHGAAAFEGHGYFGARAIRIGDGMLVAVRTGG